MNLCGLFNSSKKVRDYKAGEVVFSEGSVGEAMYVVLEGEVEARVNNKVFPIQTGEFFGEMALIDSRPRSATTVAKTDCRLAVVDEREFLFLVQQTPFFGLHVMRVLVERIRAMHHAFS